MYFALHAQDTISKPVAGAKNNTVYIELLGNGASWASLNYERIVRFNKLKHIEHAFRVGFSFSSNRYDKSAMYNVPFELNTLVGGPVHFAEIGLGLTAFLGTSNLSDNRIPPEQKSNYSFTYFIRIGYRYTGNQVVLRVAPLLGYVKENRFSTTRYCILGLGLSIGQSFNFRKSPDRKDAYVQ